MNLQEKVSLIIQYSLLVSGQEEDFRDQDLRPIHLIKYVYLADLEYAIIHEGETFTGVNWKFYNFGPYANEVYFQIEPAANSIHATKKTFPSDYGDKKEWCCYRQNDDTMNDEISSQLPFIITASLRRHIHEHTNNTPDLLNFVYNTAPMRNAAPDEYLDFSYALTESIEKETEFTPYLQTLSIKKQKKTKRELKELKALFQQRKQKHKSWRKTLVKPPREPRYDEVFEEGIKWLDSLGGEPIQKSQLEVSFDDSVWKSSTRRMDGAF